MDRLGEQARAIGGVLVAGGLVGHFPVEAVAEGAVRADGGVVGVLVVQRGGSFIAAELERVEHALQLQQAAGLRIVVERRGGAAAGGQEAVAAGAPEFGAAARLAVGVVVGEVAEELQAVADVEPAIDVAGVVRARVEDRTRSRLRERTAVGAARRGGHRGVAECVARGLARIEGIGVDGAARAGIAADGDQRKRRVGDATERPSAGVGEEVALAGEHRVPLLVLQGIHGAPAVAAGAARELELAAVAATSRGGADGQAEVVPVDVLAGHDVDHAGDGVRTVDRRCAAGQDFDALDDRGRNGLDVDDVVVAVVGLRVLGRATAVHQGQGVTGAEVAQVDDLRIGGEAGHGQVAGERRRGVLGQRLQHVADGLEAFALDVGAGDHGDRCRAFDVHALDARTDDGDLVQGLGAVLAGGGGGVGLVRRLVLCHCRGGGQQHRGGKRQREWATGEADIGADSHGFPL